MNVPLWVWVATIVLIVGLFFFDFFAHLRTPHEPTIKEAAKWSAFYLSIAVAFGILILFIWDSQHGLEYFAGFLTEYSLSIDNLFIFLIIMGSFAVPRMYQQKVLMIGIAIALVMRGVFIALGAAIIESFSWVFYIFGAFLLLTAWKLANDNHDEDAELSLIHISEPTRPY